MKKLLVLLVLLMTLSACNEEPEVGENFTVSFQSNGGDSNS